MRITLNSVKCLFKINHTLRPDVGSLVGIKCIYQMGNERDIFVLIGIFSTLGLIKKHDLFLLGFYFLLIV